MFQCRKVLFAHLLKVCSPTANIRARFHQMNQVPLGNASHQHLHLDQTIHQQHPTKATSAQTMASANPAPLEGIDDYQKALEFFQKGKHRIAVELLRRVLKQLERNSLHESESYVLVLRKLVAGQNFLRQYHDSEDTLEKIIELSQRIQSTESLLLYKEYNNLFLHCLRTNLNKAILLGKALLSDTERKNIPIAYQKIFLFNLGTAFVLKGNFVDAKARLREVLTMEPNTQLKGFALNNLAVASWWHKHPNFREEEQDLDETEQGNGKIGLKKNAFDITAAENAVPQQQEQQQEQQQQQLEYSLQQIDRDFDNVLPLFKRAIYNLENVDQIRDFELKAKLKILLDSDRILPLEFQKFDPAQQLLLSNRYSGIPLLNLQEFLFNTNPDKRNEATFWFKYCIKFFEHVDPGNIDRCMITLALFCASAQQLDKAEQLFQKALQLLDDSDSYNKVLCLQLYGNFLKKLPGAKQKEGENLIARAYQLADELPFWSNKLIHISIPDLEL